jgi:hypothetical protein
MDDPGLAVDAGALDDAVAANKPDEIWVGYWFSGRVTRIRMEGEHLSMTHYGREQGLRGEMSYFLGFDAAGRLWSGSDQGVRVWNGEHWTQYDQSDGLIWNDCDLGAFAAEPDGTVWIGTSGGLGRFQPSRMERAARPPSAVFTKLVLGNRVVEAGRYVSIGHRLNSLTAQYSALTFAHEAPSCSGTGWNRSLAIGGKRRCTRCSFPDCRRTITGWRWKRAMLGANGVHSRPCSLLKSSRRGGAPGGFAPWPPPPLALVRMVWRWRVLHLVRRQKELERAVAERTRELRREKQDLLAAREALHERAIKDGLTGLFNRRAFFDILEREFARIKRQSGSLALIMADLDLFKKINDTYGHLAGDAVLQECARRILACGAAL